MKATVSARNPGERFTAPGIPKVRRTFVVDLEYGLHARPCAMLVQALGPYSATIDVEANGEKASGKSILGLMSLAAGAGAEITFTIVGQNAHQAMADVGRLFDNKFGTAGPTGLKIAN